VTAFVPATPKSQSAPALPLPVPALNVVRVEYQPVSVELSVQAMPVVGVLVSESKFCVDGLPSVVRLTHCAMARGAASASRTEHKRANEVRRTIMSFSGWF
jgi:hypothetical protein